MPYILVVDDDGAIREMIALLLRSHDYEVATANDGAEALAMMRQRHPCLVILDIQMPVMDGFDFRERQLADASLAEVPVVCMTGIVQPRDVERRLGVACLDKPLDFPSVIRTVERACGMRGTLSMAPPKPPPALSFSDLQARVRSTSPEDLERRYRECLHRGHIWRPLTEHPFVTASPAEYCPTCLRVRGATFEGWHTAEDPPEP